MLEVFPEGVLDNSVHTAILVGLVVTWAMYEWFGWVFAGFVVPGYLAALAVVAPQSLAVVLVEAVLTYGIVWVLATGVPALRGYSHVFGRERFLLFVLVAFPVRLVVTGIAMPALTEHLAAAGLPREDLGLGLFGVGVVLVPLTANTFYKLGISRGLVQLGVTTGATWLVVGPLLDWATNFRFGQFEQIFDSLAVSAWASSRAVLVLLCTVFVAAQNNLRYGWDFGGILVPALLAMLVFDPPKYLTTIAEMFVLYGIYRAVLKLPFVAALDLEGPRRVVSIYFVSWAWKWALASAVAALSLRVPVSDVFGFGYLLTSLVVARAHKSGGVLRAVVPIVWTSLQGVALALPLAFALDRLPLAAPEPEPDPDPLPEDVEIAAPVLASWSRPDAPSPGLLDVPVPALLPVDDVEVRAGDARCTARVPMSEARAGSAPFVLWCGGDGPVLVVPRPRGDTAAAWLAGWLAPRLDARAVVVASADTSRHPTRRAYADALARQVVAAARSASGEAPLLVLASATAGPSRLHLRDPSRGSPLALRAVLPDLVLDTGAVPAVADPWWDLLAPADGVLVLAPDVVAAPVRARDPLPLDEAVTLVPTAVPRRPDLLVDVVLPAARAATGTEPDGPVPGWLYHLAGLVGAEWHDAVDAHGRAHWVLVRRSDVGNGVERWIFRPTGQPWAVFVAQAWRWPGLVPVALRHQAVLDARVVWLSGQPPLTDVRWRPAGGGSSLQDAVVRALLAPDPGWRDGGAASPPGHVVLVEAAPEPVDTVVVSHGNEVVEAPTLARLLPWLSTLLEPWPGWKPVADGTPASAWQPVSAFAASYQQAIAEDQLLIVWYPPDLLREPRAAPDHEARLAWYRAAGVPVHAVGDVGARLAEEASGDPLPLPPIERRLAAHADVPTEGTLAALRALDGWAVEVWEDDLRVVVVARSSDVLCTRVARAADSVSFPWSGCWRRR